ncbi:MAG: serine/threonine protein kinase [Planctomycetes bacterium]|nr:serine/threonine protein kinase [Planctomycetota bacterium]
MDTRPTDPWHDSWIEQLAEFDEALRLGRHPTDGARADPAYLQAQQFLLRLQSIWPRAPKKIGPYTLVRSLGQGAIGPSYLVEDPQDQQPRVLKLLWPDLSTHAPTREQFLRDARTAQHLQHAGIVAVREVRDQGPLCVVVSDYCEGVSLAQWRRKKPQPIAWDIAAQLVVQLADILEVAHQHGVCHGNLKPTNIFLSGAGEITPANVHTAAARISDFALANAVQQSRVPSHGALAWPLPQFLPPELLRHPARAAEPASDLYSLGVLWYDLLTGRCPVKGATREECRASTRHAVPPPRQYRPEVPAAVEALVLRCLKRRASERPKSAEQLAEALRALLPVAVPKETPVWWKRWLGWK